MTDNIMLSTSPDHPLTHWKQTLFYLPEGIEVQKDGKIAGKVFVGHQKENPRALWFPISYKAQTMKKSRSQSYKDYEVIRYMNAKELEELELMPILNQPYYQNQLAIEKLEKDFEWGWDWQRLDRVFNQLQLNNLLMRSLGCCKCNQQMFDSHTRIDRGRIVLHRVPNTVSPQVTLMDETIIGRLKKDSEISKHFLKEEMSTVSMDPIWIYDGGQWQMAKVGNDHQCLKNQSQVSSSYQEGLNIATPPCSLVAHR
ncbi:protein arginine n-methyltransferase 6 [Stylonychia lemnae]|uniref:Protein arginine n-methyltransferase 6 n=1 Tax=Stylonychia lemnae TaxID=5949 RepID=A0A078BC14_STYLE|nr:protein arginine n-methyltransferase 6 [Stylonychia lemnae]|eukprot:CDW91751.1 protein arginine n-methyltransferase 6 [Stylonychia lemnae]